MFYFPARNRNRGTRKPWELYFSRRRWHGDNVRTERDTRQKGGKFERQNHYPNKNGAQELMGTAT